jgi:hypothetical protein
MEKYGRKFPVSLLSIEFYAIESEKNKEDDNLLYDALVNTVVKTCAINSPDQDDLKYFLSRLEGIRDSLKGSGEGVAKGKDVKTFGSSYLKYLTNLSIDSTLLKMTGYDMAAAARLYCEIDRDDVQKLVDEYVTGKSEENLVLMESSMYGFGGSYADDSGAKGPQKSFDLNSAEGLNALKGLGF